MANGFSHFSNADLARRTLALPGRTVLEIELAERLLDTVPRYRGVAPPLTPAQLAGHEANATNFTNFTTNP